MSSLWSRTAVGDVRAFCEVTHWKPCRLSAPPTGVAWCVTVGFEFLVRGRSWDSRKQPEKGVLLCRAVARSGRPTQAALRQLLFLFLGGSSLAKNPALRSGSIYSGDSSLPMK